MKEIKIVQGYRPDEYSEKDHIFGSGATPSPIILPSGNWRKAVSLLEEFQATRGFENYGCVTFTELNAFEKLAKLILGEDWNKSERFTYIASDTDPARGGNSPRTVADSIRKIGVVDEKELPFDDSINTFEKFNSPKPLTNDLIVKGKKFLDDYKVGYDILSNVSRDALREMCKRSPVAIAVHAWTEKDGIYIRPQGAGDTHLALLEHVKDNDELEVFDSYPPAYKTLSSDFPIYFAMRFYLEKRTKRVSLFTQIWLAIRGLFASLGLGAEGNTPKWILIHTTALSRVAYPSQLWVVNNSHQARDFPLSSKGFFVGYHRLSTNGTEYHTRDDLEVGAHCNQWTDGLSLNFQSLGYCMGFNGDTEMPDPRDVENMKRTVKGWMKKYNIPLSRVVYHRRFTPWKTCAGLKMTDEWIRTQLKDDTPPTIEELQERLSLLQKLLKLYQMLFAIRLRMGGDNGCGAEKG